MIFIISGFSFFSCHQEQNNDSNTRNKEIEDTLLSQIRIFNDFIGDTFLVAVKNNAAPKEIQHDFLRARILYKKFEWAAEYFMGANSVLVNGPPIPEVEDADILDPTYVYALKPSGLQVMEEMIFPKYEKKNKEALLQQIQLLSRNTGYYQDFFSDHSISDWRILDAAKLEIFRILTLGITGYDNPLTLNSMEESAVSMESLQKVLSYYSTSNKDSDLTVLIRQSVQYLRKNKDFDSFDRATFITKYGNKISTAITQLQYKYHGFDIQYNRMLRQQAKTLFDTNAYNVNAFVPGRKYRYTEEKAALGKRLFSDPHLSGTGTRSCASCHQSDQAFTDGLKVNTNIHNGEPLPRNTPTLLNVALQSNLFYDMRALTLEDQARDVLENPDEMDGSLKEIVAYLSSDSTYKSLFSKAFPNWSEKGIDSMQVLNALASYDRSLTKLNSRFDQYMRGDSTALTSREIKGFNLFMGKAKCATCHFMPLFNGVTPPKFVESETEVIGVPRSMTDTTLDSDIGWYKYIGVPFYKHAFKIPTIRNISKTAPYMHNGIYATLKEVMDFYNNAGGVGMGLQIPNSTLPEDSLHLTQQEEEDVIAFMKSLNSQMTEAESEK